MEELTVKISAKRTSAEKTPFSWAVGVPKDWVAERPGLPERMQLKHDNGRFVLFFTENGNKLSVTDGKFLWVTISPLWQNNVHSPYEGMLAIEFRAEYDAELNQVSVLAENYTPMMLRCMEVDPPPRNLAALERHDKFKVKPRNIPTTSSKHNFNVKPPSNIKSQIQEQKASDLLDIFAALKPNDGSEPNTNPNPNALILQTLPNKVSHWHDDNIKKLRMLIMDLQASRPDIVFSVVNGIVVMRKQTFEDI